METPEARGRTPSLEVRAALLDAAEQVLREAGPTGVTVRNVAERAGVAPAGVYSRFGDKNGLAIALRVRGFERLKDVVDGAPGDDPMERLAAAGLLYRDFALANPELYMVMFEDSIAARRPDKAADFHEKPAFLALVAHVQAALIELARRNQLNGDDDATEIAQLIWSAVHGAVSLELKGLIKTSDPAASYRRLEDVLIRGISLRR